jgi:hypothetical protein
MKRRQPWSCCVFAMALLSCDARLVGAGADAVGVLSRKDKVTRRCAAAQRDFRCNRGPVNDSRHRGDCCRSDLLVAPIREIQLS